MEIPSANDVSARKPSSRWASPVSRTLRWSSPSRGGSKIASTSAPAAFRHSSNRSRTDVATPVPMLKTPAGRPRVGEHDPSDVADEDVVALLGAVAEDVRHLVAGQASEEDGDHARLPVGVLARAVDVAEAQGRVPARRRGGCTSPGTPRLRASRRRRASARCDSSRWPAPRTRRRWRRRWRRRRCATRAARGFEGGSSRGRSPRRRTPVARPRRGRLPGPRGGDRLPGAGRRTPSRRLPRRGCRQRRASRPIHVLRLPLERSSSTTLVAACDQRVDDVRADEPRAPCDDRPHPRILRRSHVRDVRGVDGSGK